MLAQITFWNDNTMMEFWENIKMLLTAIQPGIMLTVAIVLAGFLIGMVVRMFRKTDEEEHEKDFEIKRY